MLELTNKTTKFLRMDRDTETDKCCCVIEHIYVNYTIYLEVRFYVLELNSCTKQKKVIRGQCVSDNKI